MEAAPMRGSPENPSERPNTSRVLNETRKAGRSLDSALSPGDRMEMAFVLSLDSLRLRISALRNQGFSDLEIRNILKGRQK